MNNPIGGSNIEFNERWPTDGTDTFGHPPLETARKQVFMPWRGVRFADAVQELYYETDGFSLDDSLPSACARTGKPPPLEPQAETWLYKSTENSIGWGDVNVAAGLFYLMTGISMREATAWVAAGLTKSVRVDEISYSSFSMPDEGESVSFYEEDTITIAISYAHKTSATNGLLKANDVQLSQLELILARIRKDPPVGTKRVRLWTDQVLSQHLRGVSDRPNWILYGLLPYAVFPVAVLFGDKTDSLSMWSACEQLLGDGGSGCLFCYEVFVPQFCKPLYCADHHGFKVVKSVGDGLAINRNLVRLSSAIHSGLLDETVTYHITDAQLLMKLAYYMQRPGVMSMSHAVTCDACLNATAREHFGFFWALRESGDTYDPADDLPVNLRERLNKTRVSLPYPKVRTRRGYAQWHGVREFLPGAGRFAKWMFPEVAKSFRVSTFVGTVVRDGAVCVSTTECVVISATQPYADKPKMSYIVLLVAGSSLYDSHARIEYSVRLNISDLESLHTGVQRMSLEGLLNSLFRHPDFDPLLGSVRFSSLMPITSVNWGNLHEEQQTSQAGYQAPESQKPTSEYQSHAGGPSVADLQGSITGQALQLTGALLEKGSNKLAKLRNKGTLFQSLKHL